MYKRLIERAVELENTQAAINILHTLKGMGVTGENLEHLLEGLKEAQKKLNKQVKDQIR